MPHRTFDAVIHDRSRFALPLCLAFLLSAVAVCAGEPQGSVWQGREIEKDGVLHVLNPGASVESPSTIAAKEVWRAGGEGDDDILFGVVSQITSDSEGNIYLLDAQLNQVMVFSAAGEYIRSMGREGEGPGEFRRASDLFFTADGNIAVMQRMPGKIVLLTPQGEPAGNMRVPDPGDGGMQMLSGGRLAGKDVVLNVNRFARRDAGFDMVTSLLSVDPSGNVVVTFYDKREPQDVANMVFDEKKLGSGALVWSTDSTGRVYTSDDFDAYRIQCWSPEGAVDRVIEREYTSRKRSSEEMERFAPVVRVRQGDRTQGPEVKASETDRDIQQIFPRENGDIWILSSKGAFDSPKGVIATFDVFDREGRFARQIALGGAGNYAEDGFYLVGDRIYVVTGLRSARRSMFGAGEGGEAEGDGEEPMTLVCYDISAAGRDDVPGR